jgi:ABC-type polysaccharide/polyol phosphate export permease
MLGGSLSGATLFLPAAFLLLFFFAFGISLTVSIATVFFRDLQHVILILMQGLFFLTPILYKHDAMAGRVGWLVGINPVVPFIELFRAPLTQASLPSMAVILQSIVMTFIALSSGLFFFLRFERKIVFRL